jgi:hypothetical protein
MVNNQNQPDSVVSQNQLESTGFCGQPELTGFNQKILGPQIRSLISAAIKMTFQSTP